MKKSQNLLNTLNKQIGDIKSIEKLLIDFKLKFKNKNFRNNQNYIISKKYIKKLKFTLYVDISELKI
jgi:uncharacterized protein YhjY with autotransporter beta-barrel domain